MAAVETAQGVGDIASQGSLVLGLIIAMLKAVSAGFLFSMIGSFQFILYVTILNIYVPANASIVFEQMLSLATADIIPEIVMQPWTNWVQSKSSHLDDSLLDIFNQRFEQMGYTQSDLLINLGSAVVFIGIQIALMMLLPLFTRTRILSRRHRQTRRLKRKLKKIEQALYWNDNIRFVIELYFELALIAAIRVFTNETDTTYELVVTILAKLLIAFLAFFFFVVMNIAFMYKSKVRRELYEEVYGTVFEDLEQRKTGSFLNTVIFIAGRVYYVLVIVTLQKNPWLQVSLICLLSLWQALYQAAIKPFEDPLMNFVELLN